MKLTTITFGLVSAILLMAGCAKKDTGTLKLTLSDSPFPAEWVAEANITVDKIEIRTSGESDTLKFIILSAEEMSFNLLDLANGVTANLVETEIPVGNYDLIRLHIVKSEIRMIDGTVYDMKIPSGSTSGLKAFISPDVEVQGGLTTELLLDFDVSKSFVALGKVTSMSDIKGFHFKPVIRVANLSTSGRITGTVFDAGDIPFPGATVSVIAADTVLSSAISDEEGFYGILGIPAGTYILTAEAPGHDLVSLTGVVVTAGNQTEKDIHF